MNPKVLLTAFTLILGQPLFAMESIPIPSPSILQKWDGKSDVEGWVKVTNKIPPENQEWTPLRVYILEEAVYHPAYPLQVVYETPDHKYKVTFGSQRTTKEEIKEEKVKFQGQGTNQFIKPFQKDKGTKGKIKGFKYEIGKAIGQYGLQKALEDATILIKNN